MLQASEVQEVQVLVEEEQEKAKTLDSIIVSLRSDLLLAREEQERLRTDWDCWGAFSCEFVCSLVSEKVLVSKYPSSATSIP